MKPVTVKTEELERFSEFACEVFIDYYRDMIGEQQARYMTGLFLSPAEMKQLQEQGALFRSIVIEGKYAAYCEYIPEKDRLFLSKLYVDKKYRGQGLGRILFDDCLNYAKDNDLKAVYLTVNKNNTHSYDIYKHLGFKVTDAVVSDIGQGYVMDDYIMEYQL